MTRARAGDAESGRDRPVNRPSTSASTVVLLAAFCLPPASLAAQARVTYRLPDGPLYRIDASAGANPVDLSAALDALAPGIDDEWVNTSPDGAWLLVSSDRFHPGCAGWPCLAVVRGDLSAGEAVVIGGAVVHSEGFGAITSAGDRIVWSGGGGAHALDLWTSRYDGASWSAPQQLTAVSAYAWHGQPALSDDGSRVVFDCGDQPYGGPGTALCAVGTEGAGFAVVITPEQGPGGTSNNALHHADFAPDGSIVFEADWEGEQIWRLAEGATTPTRITGEFNNDNSPCVLGDGRIASLWLDRAGGSGYHELKVMAADGASYLMLLTDVDVLDGGIGCSDPAASLIFADGFESGSCSGWDLGTP
jgi:hypothetical protein